MKKIFLIFIVFYFSFLSAYDFSMINLINPSGLDAKQAELMIRHRFYGDITDEPLDNFLGMDAGANVNLSARYQFIRNAELKLGYSRRKSEKTLGASYKIEIDDFPIIGQVGLDYFSYEEVSQPETTRRNIFPYFALQNEEVIDRLVATINTGFDGYNERFVLGAGLTVRILDNMSLLFEYYPVLDRDSASDELAFYLGEEDAYSFAIKFDTYGHQFTFLLSNTDNIGIRRCSLGAEKDSYLHLGFNIQRRLEW
ncbi:MAG: DUF5777 family beta-barrel protein [Candidatus Cloacimonetes bacterium]|nr:DUF5777 family beta-barrel protein [Candidatus Cloacimonadota bacterium]MCF7813590.1 DUF5777 family beta-barrel protein [Candidatus Cloacimonadota bacterium]MCF7868221.1 DUF5777 family beta-barrel protein [Candidatus Cloacimonadota bacterium]MCF7883615.1 DUF5777 family beta-barrel protein [Candidatus Cloacimonadota bacterium]